MTFWVSCVKKREVVNEKKGSLISAHQLVTVNEKTFPLDQYSAPRPPYLHFSPAENVLSVLNAANKTIYFYDYKTGELTDKQTIGSPDFREVYAIGAYHISEKGFTYLYDKAKHRIFVYDKNNKYISGISLSGDMPVNAPKWSLRYPQYNPTASSPFHEMNDRLFLSGFYPWAIPDAILDTFKFTSIIDINTQNIDFKNLYPRSLYGPEFDWDDPIYNTVYSDTGKDPGQLIFSFPISHDLYIVDTKTGKRDSTFAGSNLANSIASIGKKKPSDLEYGKKLRNQLIKTDLYGSIKYDKYRNVYYRFVRGAIEGDELSIKSWEAKPLRVIIMNEHFRFLGETTLGSIDEWNMENSFVTEEGLNIEYVDRKEYNEDYLRFKIFIPQKL